MPLFVMLMQLAPHRVVQLVSDHREAIGPDEILEAATGVVVSVILRARFGVAGGYTADIIPTKAGQYLFRFFGEISGDKIDEKFESGPGRFNDVDDPARLEFPVPRGAAAPATSASGDQVAAIAREV